MSFEIILQKNNSENININKDISNILTLSGTLKNQTSIINPSIIIEANLANITTCNYLTIPSFNRSYFISNIESLRNNLVEISAHVDVISSFKSEILANTAIVKRQENNWNLYIDDGIFKTYQNPIVITKAFPSGFTTQEFVLAVAGS